MDRQSNLYFVLPGNHHPTLTVARSTRSTDYRDYVVLWEGTGYIAEPHIEIKDIDHGSILSIFTVSAEEDGKAYVIVLDLDVSYS